ncbi:GNAT family N-acetyltransferase [Gorillibacterium massiliense]|uniref:GNAT family N-acetyltransferase n=1 Tax=Gorillibacterium massiliense TaxID=1280390 RepID=UPI0004B06C05|nr:GNAT family N-acetyltransferase [Gorillibacterium massiliense]
MTMKALGMDDLETWNQFAHEISDDMVGQLITDTTIFYKDFYSYMKAKIKQNEVFMEIDEDAKRCVGVIAFSRNHNRITFFGVSGVCDYETIGSSLVNVAIEKLDSLREITVNILKGDFEPLLKQKELFEKYSFFECDNAIFEDGVPAYKMLRTPH